VPPDAGSSLANGEGNGDGSEVAGGNVGTDPDGGDFVDADKGNEGDAGSATDSCGLMDAGQSLTDAGAPGSGDAVPPALVAILDDIPGYASGTIGGKNGTVYEVTTLDDDDSINIRNGSHHIWIHHCQFTNHIDGSIDAKFDEGFPFSTTSPSPIIFIPKRTNPWHSAPTI
jgi:hypothetical protein